MPINQAGIDLIKRLEGFRSTPYYCSGGKRTIGYGHVILPEDGRLDHVTEPEGEALLLEDIEKACNSAINCGVLPWLLTENQWAAVVSFTFNLGGGNLQRSTLLKHLHFARWDKAAEEFPKWNRAAGVVLKGLVKRRAAEQALFLTPGKKVRGNTTEKEK